MCHQDTRPHSPAWLTGRLEAEGKEFWLHWAVGAEMRGAGPKCGGQVLLCPFLVPRSSGFGVMTSGSLGGDPPDRLNTCFSGQYVRDTQKWEILFMKECFKSIKSQVIDYCSSGIGFLGKPYFSSACCLQVPICHLAFRTHVLKRSQAHHVCPLGTTTKSFFTQEFSACKMGKQFGL